MIGAGPAGSLLSIYLAQWGNYRYAVASGAYDLVMAIGVEKLKDNGMSGLTGVQIPDDGTKASITAPASVA